MLQAVQFQGEVVEAVLVHTESTSDGASTKTKYLARLIPPDPIQNFYISVGKTVGVSVKVQNYSICIFLSD